MVQGDCRSSCYHGKCPRAGECQFIHDSTKRGKITSASQAPNKGKGPSKGQGQQRKGKGKGRGKSAGSPKPKIPRGKSPTGAPDKLPCKYFLRDGKCSKGESCTYWHPPPCHQFQNGSCKKGETCSFLHRKKSPAMPAKTNSPNRGEGGPSQEPLIDSEGFEKKISRSASRKRKKAAAAAKSRQRLRCSWIGHCKHGYGSRKFYRRKTTNTDFLERDFTELEHQLHY